MHVLLILLLLFVYLNPQIINAGEKEQYLRRVSMLLRGVPPKYEETDSLQFLNDVQYKKYLRKMISDYSDSSLFNEKMRVRLLELLQMKITPRLSPELFSSTSFFLEASNDFLSTQISNTVLDQYLVDLFKDNKNWNHLLTGHNYNINVSSGNAHAELDFYQDVVDVSRYSNSINSINIAPIQNSKKQALAGVITTPRFFERYFTTDANKSRARALAIYKIFLCDSVFVEHSFTDDDKQRLINISLNINSHETPPHALAVQNEKVIESGKCVQCRSKLDLLGKAFDQSILRPSTEKIAGRLIYKTSDNSAVDIHFENVNQMAQAIVKQKEFLSCQTDYFWNWFVGSDVKNTNKDDLMRFFDKKNRQPKELIKKILIDNFDFFRSQHAQPSSLDFTFGNTFNRSLQNFDFYESIKFQFNLDSTFISQCRLGEFDLSALGLINPQTGMRSPLKPTLVYYQALYKCSRLLTKLNYPIVDVKFTQKMWENASLLDRKVLTLEVINKILGHNLYSNERTNKLTDQIFSIVEEVLEKEKKKNNLTFAINTIASYVVLTPDFLYL